MLTKHVKHVLNTSLVAAVALVVTVAGIFYLFGPSIVSSAPDAKIKISEAPATQMRTDNITMDYLSAHLRR